MRQPGATEARSGLDAVAGLWRRRWLFAAVFVATLGAAIAALVILPVRYLATASVIVAEQEPGAGNVSAVWAQKLGDPADLESQLLVIRSPRLMRQVMTAPGVIAAVVAECERGKLLGANASCDRLKTDAGAFIDHVEGRFGVASAGRSRVINISYQSGLPEVAQTLANALTQAFLEDQRNEGANSREVASSWIRQELKQLDGQLRAADEKIQTFRRTKGLMRGATAPISSERLTSIGQQLSQAEAARAEAAARLQEIRSEQERGPTDAPSVLSSRTIADLKQQLTNVSTQLASATGALGPKHPAMLALTREQATIQQRLVDEMKAIAASAQKAFDANDTLVAALKKEMEAAKAEAGSATLDEASIESMVRDTEIKRQQYAELYRKASELETERRVLRGSTRLVSLAELPSRPFFPKKLPFLAAGGILALIFAVVAALVADRIGPLGGDRVRTSPPIKPAPRTDDAAEREEIVAPEVAPRVAPAESEPLDGPPLAPEPPTAEAPRWPMVGQAPILACLPRLKSLRQLSTVGAILQDYRKLAIPQLLRLAAEDGAFQSHVHGLVRDLGIGAGRGVQRIAVTSPSEGDGKTSTVLVLAEHLAASDRRVLMVEFDSARPMFAAVLGLPPGHGLLAALSGQCSVAEAVLTTDHPGLDVLPLGRGSREAVERLGATGLADLLAGLDGYDVVLIDTPLPAQAGAQFAGLDHVIVCVRSDRSLIEPALAALGRVSALGADSVGIVVTMTEPERDAATDAPSADADLYARAG